MADSNDGEARGLRVKRAGAPGGEVAGRNVRLKEAPDPMVADAYSRRAKMFETQGKLDEALEDHKKCLKIRLEALGEDHPDVAATRSDIARQERYEPPPPGDTAEGTKLAMALVATSAIASSPSPAR